MLMSRAAILNLGVSEVLPNFRVGNPTSRGVPAEISNFPSSNEMKARACL